MILKNRKAILFSDFFFGQPLAGLVEVMEGLRAGPFTTSAFVSNRSGFAAAGLLGSPRRSGLHRFSTAAAFRCSPCCAKSCRKYVGLTRVPERKSLVKPDSSAKNQF